MPLVVLSTHPIQYQAPVYRSLQTKFNIPTSVIYGSDFSVVGYHDQQFGREIAWDTHLLDGYQAIFLSRTTNGAAASDAEVSAAGMEKAMSNLSPDAILLLGYRPGFDLRAFRIARRTGLPLLFRGETTDHAHQRGLAKRLLRDGFLRWYYRHFARLLYVGQRSLAHYKRLGCSDEQLIFSPYCVDSGMFRLDEAEHQRLRLKTRSRLQIPVNKKVLIVSGKINRHKAPGLLIQAVRTLPTELREQVVVLFLGDGELRPFLESLTAETPTVEARFTGFQNQTQLSDYYHAADVLVMPSQSETWGLVVNESLHHGLPCIVSDRVGCAPDLIKPGVTGEVFTVNSAPDLALALRRAFKLLERPDLADKCRDVVSGYTVDEAARGIAAAYRAVVSH